MHPQDEALWNMFINDFKNTWKDTSVIEDAQLKLDSLEMGKNVNLEDYIAKFNALILELGWAQNHPGTVRAFQQGLRAGLLTAIYRQRLWPNESDLLAWQDSAREEEVRGQKIRQNIGYGRRDKSVRESRLIALKMGFSKQQGEPFQKNGQKPQRDPDARDGDVAETPMEANGTFKNLSNEERKRLQAEGRCFRCKKQGHMSKDCPLKGKRNMKKLVRFKRKACPTETINESSEEEDEEANVANMEDV